MAQKIYLQLSWKLPFQYQLHDKYVYEKVYTSTNHVILT